MLNLPFLNKNSRNAHHITPAQPPKRTIWWVSTGSRLWKQITCKSRFAFLIFLFPQKDSRSSNSASIVCGKTSKDEIFLAFPSPPSPLLCCFFPSCSSFLRSLPNIYLILRSMRSDVLLTMFHATKNIAIFMCWSVLQKWTLCQGAKTRRTACP